MRPSASTGEHAAPLVEALLRLADDRLVLGHRLSEWCGHAPILEEDIALANIALDLIGQASLLLEHAGQVEGRGRSADALAYFRDAVEFRNLLLAELPNGDFAVTIVRQFLWSAFAVPHLKQLSASADATLAGIAAKGHKEATYHLRHAADWVLKLGDGTVESHARAQRALDELWPYVHEMFRTDDVEAPLVAAGVTIDPSTLQLAWRESVASVCRAATLKVPGDGWKAQGGREGRHTEHLGHLLGEMQILARSHPGAEW
ncbi:MAG: phenylacetate-CoA oxygenase subunit PaaC [Gemmatimonadetes bacterium]|nr:phenylacetate-CoA oxygenase subunit PaaC [Gemmatimonadota bacterium]